MVYNSTLIPIIFVELGRRPNKYLKNNLSITRALFPNRKIVLILSKKYLNEIDILGIEKVAEEEIIKNSMLLKFESIQKNWSRLQKNYWTNTTKRFFILGMYMYQHHLDQAVHLESDCILLSDKWLNEEFQKSNWGIKFPKQHESYGCASIFIVNNLGALNKLLDFILQNWSRGEITDMNLLGEFVEIEKDASFLPSSNLIDSSSTHIYDGVSIGYFFLGTDARNQRLPFSARGLRDLNVSALALVKPEIQLTDQGVLVYKDIGLPKLELVNIHIHSKRIPKSYKALEKIILRDSRGRVNLLWRLGAFDKLVFSERLVSFLSRRILRKKHFEYRLR
jgi:hypothetical protein